MTMATASSGLWLSDRSIADDTCYAHVIDYKKKNALSNVLFLKTNFYVVRQVYY